MFGFNREPVVEIQERVVFGQPVLIDPELFVRLQQGIGSRLSEKIWYKALWVLQTGEDKRGMSTYAFMNAVGIRGFDTAKAVKGKLEMALAAQREVIARQMVLERAAREE